MEAVDGNRIFVPEQGLERTTEYPEQLLQQAQKPFVMLADCLDAFGIHVFKYGFRTCATSSREEKFF